jgi:hypothetical protein
LRTLENISFSHLLEIQPCLGKLKPALGGRAKSGF